ncbi:M15 family metallopeptidase [Virgibacillus byunsanensis]|uniref:M15 family metallopeptidase n=1 Tax=Virgibacillus byunsanensis TaxID=570945 RepID=A0ABW3LM21_9BACI
MNKLKKDILAWITVIIFIVIIFVLYNRLEDQYMDLGEDAPIPIELHPLVEEKKDILLEQASNLDIEVVIIEKTRSIRRQNELYAQGRSKQGDIVTYARGGESYHNYGLAIDYTLQDENGEMIWDTQYDGNGNGESDWFEVAELAKNLGFEWGGDWNNFKDYPHLQMDFGLSINQLKRGLRPSYEENKE